VEVDDRPAVQRFVVGEPYHPPSGPVEVEQPEGAVEGPTKSGVASMIATRRAMAPSPAPAR
jgi:hypothetical protein